MLFSSLIPTRWRRNYDSTDPNRPGLYNRAVTPYLQAVSQKACTHPVYTIAFVVVIGSGFYANLLDTGFFQPSHLGGSNKVNFAALSTGSRHLHVGHETAWKWQADELGAVGRIQRSEEDMALVTLSFSSDKQAQYAIPSARDIMARDEGSAVVVPSGGKASGSFDSTLAFAMPYSQAPTFLESIREIPAARLPGSQSEDGSDDEEEQKRWLMNTGNRSNGGGVFSWFRDSWASFSDLVKNAETLDIIIMSLGYLAMYLTFISLFVSMRRMGSNFWLGTTVMFSSAFAFLFGIMVTLQLGVPENVVLLSEGVPFLVVTVGFEKPIVLTQAVLSASIQARNNGNANGNGNGDAPLIIQNAVQQAVRERGFEIVRDYLIEILILCIGAASGIQGGLRQFCFLAAWTLFFDCILLFTFYTSVLTIKLEINRIKRHVTLRRALEEDGVSRRVAENVASSNEWPRDNIFSQENDRSIFGRKVKDGSIPRFKVLMVTGFILINVLNLCSLPFRGGRYAATVPTPNLASVASRPLDPFEVAGSSLESLLKQTTKSKQELSVTVFSPVKYDLRLPSEQYAAEQESDSSLLNNDYIDRLPINIVGARVVESLLKSFEDPVLSKWVITALAMSLVLNGYLFNAARWSIKEPETEQTSPPDITVDTSRASAQSHSPANGHAIAPAVKVNDENAAIPGTPTAPEIPGGGLRKRTRSEIEDMLKSKQAAYLDDEEIIDLSLRGKIPGYALEKTLEDKTRAVKVRRAVISRTPATKEVSSRLEKSKLPYEHFDYDRVHGACCENVIGYMPLPLGVAGPINIDGKSYFLPMATTEGVLVASTSRGAKAINAGGGCVTVLTGDGMTRGPCIGFETLARAAAAKIWLDSPEGQKKMKDAFNSTSRFARLQHMKSAIAGTYVYVRFKTTTGDAMGMNMISKGVEHSLKVMSQEAGFEDMAVITVSGNYCTDKKPAAINWIDGRGKSVVAEAIIPGEVVRSVLKSDVNALVELNTSKNFIGSAMAGSIGGFNAHASNLVTAIFLATGQDPAQNVESSNCITVMKK